MLHHSKMHICYLTIGLSLENIIRYLHFTFISTKLEEDLPSEF